MADEGLDTVRLRQDFYHDGYHSIFIVLLALAAAIGLLTMISLYLLFDHPAPVGFRTGAEWRLVPPIPVDEPYVSEGDLMQWLSSALPKVFTIDFLHSRDELSASQVYFTKNGWSRLNEQMKNAIDLNSLQTFRQFVFTSPRAAPVLINQGLLPEGNYGWWVQMPLNIIYSNSAAKTTEASVTVKALVVRVSTLDNLSGIAIDNIEVTKDTGGTVSTNG